MRVVRRQDEAMQSGMGDELPRVCKQRARENRLLQAIEGNEGPSVCISLHVCMMMMMITINIIIVFVILLLLITTTISLEILVYGAEPRTM